MKLKGLIFGIDGASYLLVQRLLAQGLLPNLRQFLQGASLHPMRCTWPPHTATGWPTLFTGRLPGEHGLYQFWECQSPEHALVVDRWNRRCERTIWDVLSAHGFKCGVFNVPMFHPPGPWPGFQVSWPLEVTLDFIRPKQLRAELRARGIDLMSDIAYMYDGNEDYSRRAAGYLELKTRGLEAALELYPVDVLTVVVTELDRISHFFWDADEPIVSSYYRRVDEVFARALEYVAPDAPVLLVSDHGFGPGERELNLHRQLAAAGFCKLKETSRPHDGVSTEELKSGTYFKNYLDDFVWPETTAYMPAPGSFGLNINLQGRQRNGAIPSDQQGKMMAALSEFLLALEADDSGEKLFDAVVPGVAAYRGVAAAQAPDLLLIPKSAAMSLGHNTGTPLWTTPVQKGMHRLEGIWALRAPAANDIPAGAVAIEDALSPFMRALGLAFDELRPGGVRSDAATAMDERQIPLDAWSCSRDRWPLPRSVEQPADDSPLAAVESTVVPAGLPEDVNVRLRKMGYL